MGLPIDSSSDKIEMNCPTTESSKSTNNIFAAIFGFLFVLIICANPFSVSICFLASLKNAVISDLLPSTQTLKLLLSRHVTSKNGQFVAPAKYVVSSLMMSL